ncbi:hypothetical protein [Rubritalea tangerina]
MIQSARIRALPSPPLTPSLRGIITIGALSHGASNMHITPRKSS